MTTKIVFFAHATTIDNELGNATGWLPGKLSGLGVCQAKELEAPLKDGLYDVIFSSDLARAIDTVIIAVGNDVDTRADWRLREAHYGDFGGQKHTFKDEMEAYIHTKFPNGESYKDVEARVASLVDDVRTLFKNKNIAVVGHQATQLALEVIVNEASWQAAIEQDWRKKKAWQPGWTYHL